MGASNRQGTRAVIVSRKKFLIQLFFSMSSLQCASAQNSCSKTMANTVVYENSSTLLPKVIADQSVQWQLATSASTQDSLGAITEYDDKITAPFVTAPPTYSANQSGLTIFKATVEPSGNIPFATAGLYIQNYQSPADCSTGAGLVVIRSGPTCSLDASNPKDVKLSCSVVYASFVNQQINPNMTWTNSNGAVVFRDENPQLAALSNSNPGLQNFTSQFAVASDDAQPYGCQLTFTAPKGESLPPFMATNVPSFTANCTVNNVLATTTTTTTATTTMTMMTLSGVSTSNPPLPSASADALSSPSSPTAAATDAPVTSTSASSPSVLSPSSSTPPPPPPSSSSTSSSGQSPMSSAPITNRPPAITTTKSDSNSDAAGKTLAIVLGLVLGSFAVGAVVCSCWCLGCCQLPFGAKRTKQPQRRRYYETPYYSPSRYPVTEETRISRSAF